MTTEEKLLIDLSRRISKYCIGMEGNISTKTANGFLIKCSGSKLSELSLGDMVEYDSKNRQINNFEKRGSIELDFHSYLLSFDKIKFVCHTHPINSIKILCTKNSSEFSEIRMFPEQVIFNGKKSCLVPYAKPGKDLKNKIQYEIENFVREEKQLPKLILLENHGIIACGKSPEECALITEICEKSAEIYIGAKQLGNLRKLTELEVCDLDNDENEKYRKKRI